MKLCVVINTLRMGGTERYAVNILKSLQSLDVDVTLLVLYKSKSHYLLPIGTKKIILNRTVNMNRVLKVNSLIAQLKVVDTAYNFTTYYVLMSNVSVVATLKLIKSTAEIVCSYRSNPYLLSKDLYSRLLITCYRSISLLVCQTKEAKSIFDKRLKKTALCVSPNMVSSKFFKEPTSLRNNVVMSAGRMITSKNQIDIIRSYAAIKTNQWSLEIYGEGPLFNHLTDQAKIAHNSNINVLEPTQNIYRKLHLSQIFCYTSLSEGFPNALLEAMAAGCCCISYDCHCGPKDLIVDGENGYLVKIGDIERFSFLLQNLINDQNLRLRLAKNSYATALKYTSHSISKELLSKLIF